MTTYVGFPTSAQVEFVDGSGQPFDPATVKLSKIEPLGTTTQYTYGVDAVVTRVSVGLYQLAFTPDSAGNWMVIGDGYDSQGNQDAAAASPVILVSPRSTQTPNGLIAQGIVEEYIGRPLRVVTETVTLYSGEDGILQLPRGPVISVASVLGNIGEVGGDDFSEGFAIGGAGWSEDQPATMPVAPVPTADGFGRIADPNVLAFTWYAVTYTHGWSEAQIPAVIRGVLTAVEARLTANPDAVASERIGAGYSVVYGAVAAAWLTDDEKKALARFRPYRASTLTTSTPLGGLP